jgi:kinesin family protein 20
MMIHVNPFDTGFDENSHVMRFSAVARDIFTTTHTPAKFVRRPELPPSQLSEALSATTASASTARPAIPQEMLKAGSTMAPVAAVVVRAPEGENVTDGGASVAAIAGAVSPRESEVERVEVEEELMASVEEEEEEDEDDEPDALVEHLFDVVKELRMKVSRVWTYIHPSHPDSDLPPNMFLSTGLRA